MPKFGIKQSNGSVHVLGDFPSIEVVFRLTALKQTPALKARVVEIADTAKPLRESNRYAIDWPDRILFLNASYTSKKHVATSVGIPLYRVRYIPRDAYHPVADSAFTDSLQWQGDS